MRVPFQDIPLHTGQLRGAIEKAMARVLDSARFIGGPEVSAFEQAFAAAMGSRFCVGTGNGTDAITLALKALGIGRGDEVIVPANTFIGTAEAVTLCGAKVVFADCDRRYRTVDPEAAAAAITDRTRAIIPVHLYGCPADMDLLLEIAARHDLSVIEDCAQSHGAAFNGIATGCFGKVGCFSFFPAKNLGALGDAGAVITGDEALSQTIRRLGNHGRLDKFDHDVSGTNSRLDALQAAVLAVKLPHLAEWTRRRQAAASLYDRGLEATGLVLPTAPLLGQHAYHLYVIEVPDRDRVIAHLREDGIETGIHYPAALPHLPAYADLGHRRGDFPVAEALQDRILSLPMFPEITPEQIDWVCRSLKRAL